MISDQFMLNRTDVTHVEKYTQCIIGVFNLSIDDTASQIILNQHGFPFPVISLQFLLTQHFYINLHKHTHTLKAMLNQNSFP